MYQRSSHDATPPLHGLQSPFRLLQHPHSLPLSATICLANHSVWFILYTSNFSVWTPINIYRADEDPKYPVSGFSMNSHSLYPLIHSPNSTTDRSRLPSTPSTPSTLSPPSKFSCRGHQQKQKSFMHTGVTTSQAHSSYLYLGIFAPLHAGREYGFRKGDAHTRSTLSAPAPAPAPLFNSLAC